MDYIKATELLDRLSTVHEPDLPNTVECVFYFMDSSYLSLLICSRSLSAYLDNLGAEYFNELLIRRLLVPFMFLCSSTRSKLIPRIIVPKDENHPNSWISIEKYRTCVVPALVDLYSYTMSLASERLFWNILIPIGS